VRPCTISWVDGWVDGQTDGGVGTGREDRPTGPGRVQAQRGRAGGCCGSPPWPGAHAAADPWGQGCHGAGGATVAVAESQP